MQHYPAHTVMSLCAQIQDCAVKCTLRSHDHSCHPLPLPLLLDLRCPCLMPYWEHFTLKVTGTGQEKLLRLQGAEGRRPQVPWISGTDSVPVQGRRDTLLGHS